MSYTTEGKIASIGEVKEFDNGAKAVSYQVETNEQYNNLYSFEMYKGADNVQHIDNFIKYNKVGDNVRVEWNVRTNKYNGRFFTSLSPWRIEKLGTGENKTEKSILEEAVENDLPF